MRVLTKVFGDGNSLAELQQRFYSYRQGDEDLLTCSLNLTELYDRMCEIDPKLRESRDSSLKGCLVEAGKDDGLHRELRRLNLEYPKLDFFELRDRAIQWWGVSPKSASRMKASMHETPAEANWEALLKRQEEMILQQQKQIELLLESAKKVTKSESRKGDRKCWVC